MPAPCDSPIEHPTGIEDTSHAVHATAVTVSEEGLYDEAFNPRLGLDDETGSVSVEDPVIPVPVGDEECNTEGALGAEIAAEFAELRMNHVLEGDCGGESVHMEGLVQLAQGALVQMGLRHRGGNVDEISEEEVRLAISELMGTDFGQDVAQNVTAELNDQMAIQLAQQLDDSKPAPRPFTVRWYQQNGDQPDTEGSTVTVRQACHFLAHHKLTSNSTVRGVDLLCGFLHRGGILPHTNKMPRCASFLPWA